MPPMPQDTGPAGMSPDQYGSPPSYGPKSTLNDGNFSWSNIDLHNLIPR